MKILLTGATGFIGQNLIKHLLDEHHSIITLIRPDSNTSALDKRVSRVVYSGKIDDLITLFQNEHFDGVIHLASLFLAAHKSQDIFGLIHSNIQFGTELLEACKLSKTPWFINTGTFWQHYENETYNPVNLYAATKQAFEDIAKYYTETSGLIFTTLKLNDTFGPNDTRNKVFNLWHSLSKTEERLDMSPGDQIIDICYIEDVIDAYKTLIRHIQSNPNLVKNKTFAIYSGERMSLKNLANVFANSIGKTLNIRWGGREYREREVMIPQDKIAPLPEWKAHYTLTEAIHKTLGVMK
jgi:nucleoside-diphosphate-sugar epimerase